MLSNRFRQQCQTGAISRLVLLAGMLVALAACGVATEHEGGSANNGAASYVAVDGGYAGFVRNAATGGDEAVRTIIFFDPLCPYCRQMWDEVASVDAHQFWVPVSLVDETSSTYAGAAILDGGGSGPAKRFDEVKRALEVGADMEIVATQESVDAVRANTQLFRESGQASVPLTFRYEVSRSSSGAVFAGAMSQNHFAEFVIHGGGVDD